MELGRWDLDVCSDVQRDGLENRKCAVSLKHLKIHLLYLRGVKVARAILPLLVLRQFSIPILVVIGSCFLLFK